jgi:hypothetical protein
VSPRCVYCQSERFTPGGRCQECRTFPTLGHEVAAWIEANLVIPDRDQVGDPFLLTEEQERFLNYFYRVNPHAKKETDRAGRTVWRNVWHYSRGGQIVRPQKWGKGPLAAAWICAEAEGPAFFDGWDAQGRPVGRPWATPLIQVSAFSEDQTDNVWGVLIPMIELGSVAAVITDTGLTRINLPRGGKIEPVSSSSQSRLGQRVTACCQDQTESWTKQNGLRTLADNQRRNLAGTGGRFLSNANAWDPRDQSVAQFTAEREEDVYVDDVTPPETLSIRNKRERLKALRQVYGGAYWVDLDRVSSEIEALLHRDAAQAERWFLNRKQAGDDAALQPTIVEARRSDHEPEAKSVITIGVDGARFSDAIGMVATEVNSGFQWPLGIWERPEHAPDDYEHPFEEIDGALAEAMETFEVWRVYIDPQWIDHLVDAWQGRYGAKRIVAWYTNRPKQTAYAVRSFLDAMGSGDATHNGDSDYVRHLKNARKQKVNVYDEEHRQMFTFSKDRHDSPQKIDGAMAAVLSWEARGDAIAADAKPKKPATIVSFA